MQIEVKFNLRDKVWVTDFDERYGCVNVVCAKISEICVNEDGNSYFVEDIDETIPEDEIIDYEDTDKLVEKLKELTKE